MSSSTSPAAAASSSATSGRRPSIALFTGDPAGISPELIAKLLADGTAQQAADILLIGSRAVVAEGARSAKVEFDFDQGPPARGLERVRLVDWAHSGTDGFERGQVTQKNGQYMLDGLKHALGLWRDGFADAICFAPLNKGALRAGGLTHADELHYFQELLAFHGPCVEFNVLENLWTSRVTSHVAHKEVSALLTREGVADGVALLTQGLKAAGIAQPRVAVCGLNPHNGDNGSFGREEIDIITPGVELAGERGYAAHGPFPADTIFVRATRKGDAGYDGVLTMYHDQGQIAMKLMGFERGVTVHGGLPVPITTPAHGTAYDIAGQGSANVGAMHNAFKLACKMARSAVAAADASH
jgi:4-hydroxy-L-threonine phosphate dehydrogenase PdxA